MAQGSTVQQRDGVADLQGHQHVSKVTVLQYQQLQIFEATPNYPQRLIMMKDFTPALREVLAFINCSSMKLGGSYCKPRQSCGCWRSCDTQGPESPGSR